MHCALDNQRIEDFSHAVAYKFLDGTVVWFHDAHEAEVYQYLTLHHDECHAEHPTPQ